MQHAPRRELASSYRASGLLSAARERKKHFSLSLGFSVPARRIKWILDIDKSSRAFPINFSRIYTTRGLYGKNCSFRDTETLLDIASFIKPNALSLDIRICLGSFQSLSKKKKRTYRNQLSTQIHEAAFGALCLSRIQYTIPNPEKKEGIYVYRRERKSRVAQKKGTAILRKIESAAEARYRTKQQSIKTKLGEPFPEFLQSN